MAATYRIQPVEAILPPQHHSTQQLLSCRRQTTARRDERSLVRL